MPKTNRSGQSLTLTPEQLDAIMTELNPICRAALSMCRFTAARINESLSLRWEKVTASDIVIPKSVTKKKMKTRTIPLSPTLAEELAKWKVEWSVVFKRHPEGHDLFFPRSS